MRKILLSFFIILFVCCAIQNNAINKSENKHYLWKISDDNSSVWLLGSIHFADSTFYPLPEVIQNAFDESEELVVEINISDDSIANEITSQSLKNGILSQDVRLTDIIKSETWRTIDSLCSVWNYSCTQFLKMRPWFVAMTLTYLAISRTGIDSDYGIDAVLIDSALVRGLTITGLETAKEQVSPLSDTTRKDTLGLYYLENTLREIKLLDSMVVQLTRAWKTGDDDLLIKVLKEETPSDKNEELSKEIEDRLYLKRNKKMANGIESFLKEDRRAFIVVGAAHLVLEKENVILLLKEKGLKVERF